MPTHGAPTPAAKVAEPAGKAVSVAIDVRVDWRTAGRDNAHSGVNPWEKTIGEASVGDLVRRWHTTLSTTDRPSNLVTSLSTYGPGPPRTAGSAAWAANPR